MTPEELEKKAQIERDVLEHYEKIMESMVRWCIYDQPPEIDIIITAFGGDKLDLTLRALETTLNKWKNHGKQ